MKREAAVILKTVFLIPPPLLSPIISQDCLPQTQEHRQATIYCQVLPHSLDLLCCLGNPASKNMEGRVGGVLVLVVMR